MNVEDRVRRAVQRHAELLWFISEACCNVGGVFLVLAVLAFALGAEQLSIAAQAPAEVLLPLGLPVIMRTLERAKW